MVGADSTARANVNVALVKYWGKRDPALNLPATGSISLTLDGLGTEAAVGFGAGEADRVVIDGVDAAGEEAKRVVRFLDLVRAAARCRERGKVVMRSTVPRGIGLASSAAAFAALALAASRAAGLALDPSGLSALARRGSGPAAGSILGAFGGGARGAPAARVLARGHGRVHASRVGAPYRRGGRLLHHRRRAPGEGALRPGGRGASGCCAGVGAGRRTDPRVRARARRRGDRMSASEGY